MRDLRATRHVKAARITDGQLVQFARWNWRRERCQLFLRRETGARSFLRPKERGSESAGERSEVSTKIQRFHSMARQQHDCRVTLG